MSSTTSRPASLLALVAALGFAAACASKPAPAPAPPPGPVAPASAELAQSGLAVVKTADIVLKDSSRNRDIPVRVTYPEALGPVPVIVFSHGAGGAARTFDALARFWATRGFAVLAPGHADGAAATAKDPGAESVREPAGDATADARTWESRARDLSFVVAATGAIEARVAGLKLDESRLGVGGQSLGAFSAMLLAGATPDASKKDKPKSFADPLPKAFLFSLHPERDSRG